MNYQKELDKLISNLQKDRKVPKLLLHSCCAPCSSYVLEYLSDYFEITVFYYNPNIFPESEYTKRILEQQMLIQDMKVKQPVSFLAGSYERDRFYEIYASTYSACFEGSRRRDSDRSRHYTDPNIYARRYCGCDEGNLSSRSER